jgi:hypothetical protein
MVMIRKNAYVSIPALVEKRSAVTETEVDVIKAVDASNKIEVSMIR